MLKSSIVKIAYFSGWLWMVDPRLVGAYLDAQAENVQSLSVFPDLTKKPISRPGAESAKRLLDIVGALAMLILLTPVLIAIAVLVKLSGGPVFFSQERIGHMARTFQIYKFRTMVPNAEDLQAELASMNEMSGPIFKIKNDPRVTPLGRFLRRTSLDELPQLFNVLKGEMSLVGPRAMALRDFEMFEPLMYRRRLLLKPGITSLWQVDRRKSISFEQWMELDLQYVDRRSIWLDLKLLRQYYASILHRLVLTEESDGEA
jgi:lipopolysaccharide/colanic/teichoic acid biosynthesis glycosyltransferase